MWKHNDTLLVSDTQVPKESEECYGRVDSEEYGVNCHCAFWSELIMIETNAVLISQISSFCLALCTKPLIPVCALV